MKSASDPRHKKRQEMVKQLFANSFTDQKKGGEVLEIFNSLERIDSEIAQSAPAWPIEKINKIDLAILRLACHELTTNNTPRKVVIDEAVELAKEFGSENSPAFVNGVLGNILRRKEGKELEEIVQN